MDRFHPLDLSVLNKYPPPDDNAAGKLLEERLRGLRRKIVVLDDDPTGVQTVHGVSVYTDWEEGTIAQAFAEQNDLFFILTNSRSFTIAQTEAVHVEIGSRIARVSQQTKTDYILISRGDSTLRGHYPLETQVLRREIEAHSAKRFDGEIIFPFFLEGGRYTLENIHYVKSGNRLIPVGETEFAKDKSFGYHSSDLTQWCAEKNAGKVQPEEVVSISLESLRALDLNHITAQLMQVSGFGKVVVNASAYADVKVFIAAYLSVLALGKEFLFRSAAAVPKILGRIPDKPLLTKEELVPDHCARGGIILVGSHVQKTTRQLEALQNSASPIRFIEFNQHRVLEQGGLEDEARRVVREAEQAIVAGETAAVYTRRTRLDLDTDDKDQQLQISVAISDALTSVIGNLEVCPRFIVAKGGITSSDVGTKALRVRKALVMGQIQAGIPVWMTGPESKFPNIPYVIFPGNVGEDSTLLDVVKMLMGDRS